MYHPVSSITHFYDTVKGVPNIKAHPYFRTCGFRYASYPFLQSSP